MKTTSLPSKKGIYAAITGSILVALCCFTPILVITLGAVGLSALTPYLDYVLLPALVMLIVLAIVSYGRWKRACKSAAKELVG
jgi:mercuric ion transport protein